jgi:hypothetical protein
VSLRIVVVDADAFNWAVTSLTSSLPDAWHGESTLAGAATLLREALQSELANAEFVFPVAYAQPGADRQVGILSLEDRATLLYGPSDPLTIVRMLLHLRGAKVAETRNVRDGRMGLIFVVGEGHDSTHFEVRLPENVTSDQRRRIRDALEARATSAGPPS